MKSNLYVVKNYDLAHKELSKMGRQKLCIINECGSCNYYGLLVVDIMLRRLLQEYPDFIKEAFLCLDNEDNLSLYAARKIGYKEIGCEEFYSVVDCPKTETLDFIFLKLKST